MHQTEQVNEIVKSKPRRKFEAEIVPLSEMERQAILHALLRVGGDKSEAARRLGIGKSTLYRKLREYGLVTEPPRPRRRRAKSEPQVRGAKLAPKPPMA